MALLVCAHYIPLSRPRPSFIIIGWYFYYFNALNCCKSSTQAQCSAANVAPEVTEVDLATLFFKYGQVLAIIPRNGGPFSLP